MAATPGSQPGGGSSILLRGTEKSGLGEQPVRERILEDPKQEMISLPPGAETVARLSLASHTRGYGAVAALLLPKQVAAGSNPAIRSTWTEVAGTV